MDSIWPVTQIWWSHALTGISFYALMQQPHFWKSSGIILWGWDPGPDTCSFWKVFLVPQLLFCIAPGLTDTSDGHNPMRYSHTSILLHYWVDTELLITKGHRNIHLLLHLQYIFVWILAKLMLSMFLTCSVRQMMSFFFPKIPVAIRRKIMSMYLSIYVTHICWKLIKDRNVASPPLKMLR